MPAAKVQVSATRERSLRMMYLQKVSMVKNHPCRPCSAWTSHSTPWPPTSCTSHTSYCVTGFEHALALAF
jgi:hypothetical protein